MSNITQYVSPQVQSALKRQWIQYKAQWGQRRREHCSMRSTSYTATSITEVPAFMFHHDCHSEHLNGKQAEDSELVALKTGETYAWPITRRCVFFTASSSWHENNIRMRFFKYVMLKLLVSEAPHIHPGPLNGESYFAETKGCVDLRNVPCFSGMWFSSRRAEMSVSEQRKILLCLNLEHSRWL